MTRPRGSTLCSPCGALVQLVPPAWFQSLSASGGWVSGLNSNRVRGADPRAAWSRVERSSLGTGRGLSRVGSAGPRLRLHCPVGSLGARADPCGVPLPSGSQLTPRGTPSRDCVWALGASGRAQGSGRGAGSVLRGCESELGFAGGGSSPGRTRPVCVWAWGRGHRGPGGPAVGVVADTGGLREARRGPLQGGRW